MANPDFPLQTNMLMDGNTIFNTFVKVVIGKTPLCYILTCIFKACYKITFRSACTLLILTIFVSLVIAPASPPLNFIPYVMLGWVFLGVIILFVLRGGLVLKQQSRIFREVSCVRLLSPGLLELWHFTYPIEALRILRP